MGNSAPLPSPDLSYLPSFGSLPHQSPLDPLPATSPLRPLGFGGLGGSGDPGGSGGPGGPGGSGGPQGPPYAPGFYGAAFTPPNPIPKVKVDAPDKFDGRPTKVKPSVWLTEVERWLRLCQIPWEAMVDSTASRLRGGALTWVNSRIADAERRGQPAFRNWQEFRDAFLRQFEPLSAQETARMQIRSHVQTGSVQAYVYKFQELMANIPSMNMDEAYHLFITGLQPHLRQLVGTLVPKNDLEAAIDMAQRSTAYGGAQMGRQEIGGGRGQQQNRSRRGQVSQIQQPSSQSSEGDFTSTTTAEVNMTSGGKTFKTGERPTRAMQKNGPRQRKKRWNQSQKTQRPNKCFFCDESGHFVRDCPKAKALRQKAEQGNA